jgi:phospholipid transport system substrate-binding protein
MMADMIKNKHNHWINTMLARILFLSLVIISIDLPAVPASPMEHVQESTEKVIAILQDKSLDREAKWQKIGVIINNRFDFRSMSQSVLATNWQEATPEERARFVEYFSQYIEATYRTKIESYTDQKVLYLKETINGKRAEVDTVIMSNSTEIPLSYKMKNNDGEWYAYDVIIEGVSLVNNYRSTFTAIVKNEGMDGLLNDIQRRIDRHKQEENLSPSPQ